MRLLCRYILLFTALLVARPLLAADITAVRSWRAPDNTRLVLDLSTATQASISPDSTPARLVVDIADGRLAGPIALPQVTAPLRALRFENTPRGQRLVVELQQEVNPRLFTLPPNEKYGHRLVLDLFDKPSPVPVATSSSAATGVAVATALPAAGTEGTGSGAAAESPATVTAPPAATGAPTTRAATTTATTAPVATTPATPTADTPAVVAAPEKPAERQPAPDPRKWRNIIVALDPGHGGEDPGAIGAKGTYEKHVTLSIARELEAMLRAEPGFTPVLTRTGDYFIPLPERRRIARHQHKADIFISIHADAAENRAARGASVFALSLAGAGSATSRFARMLAERENRSDLIGGAALENGDDTLRNVLADMVVAGSLDHSLHLGRNILDRFSHFTSLHSRRVEQAGFAVLKEPGMVSLLVETGFISNPDEEQKLIDKRHQRELARAVFDGLLRYKRTYPAPGSYFAWEAEQRSRGKVAAAPDSATVAAVSQAGSDSPHASRPVLAETRRADALLNNRPAAPKTRRYKVVSGDNLTRIASRHNVSMAELRRLNALKDDNVRIGQVLVIPVN